MKQAKEDIGALGEFEENVAPPPPRIEVDMSAAPEAGPWRIDCGLQVETVDAMMHHRLGLGLQDPVAARRAEGEGEFAVSK